MRFVRLLATSAVFAVGTAACNNDKPTVLDGVSVGVNPTGAECSSPTKGCACPTEGATADCGSVERIEGSYVSCSMGHTTCAAGAWGECIGTQISTHTLPMSTQGLGVPAKCVGNPCDPDCMVVTDSTDGGIDAGALVVDDSGGISLQGVLQNITSTCSSLAIAPITTTMTVTNMTTPGSLQFTPSLLPNGCYNGPVPALWTVDKFDIAQISTSGLLTVATPIAGDIVINAYAGTLAAPTATVKVVVTSTDASGAPSGILASMFSGLGSTADVIEILYPYTNTMFPLGQVAPLIQWRDGGLVADAVEITLRYPPTGTPIFSWSEIVPEKTTFPAVGIAAQPRAQLPQSAWFAFEQTVAKNRATLGDSGQIGIQRRISSVLRTETKRNVRFADGQLKGKIYYNSYGTNLVKNFGNTYGGARFGAATLVIPAGASAPTAVAGVDSATNGPGCRVCHSVSPNGNQLATLRDDYTAVSYNLLQSPLVETVMGSSGKYAWPALAPDGSYLFSDASSLPGSGGSKSALYLLNGTAMVGPATIFTSLKAGTPAFRGDAAQIAFNFFGGTAAPVANPPSGVTTGDAKTLSIMDFNATTKVFSSFKNIYTPATGAAIWPSFLPPGQNGVVFEKELIRSRNGGWGFTRSNCDSRDGACNNTGATGELWWSNTTGAAQPVALANANGVGLPVGPNLHGSGAYTGDDGGGNLVTTANFNDALYNYEPTVLPIQSAGYSWVVFTSRRMYGNVATVNPYWSDPRFRDISKEPTPKKLWIAAIANNPAAGSDPSFPAFYLPGQELLAGNSRGYFALDACKPPGAPTPANVCDTDLDCCGGSTNPKTAVCKLDAPLTSPPVRHCVSTGGSSCSADGAACGSDAACCNFGSGSRCSNGTCAVPPPIVVYQQASFVREYTAVCPIQKRPLWRFFEWQSNTPLQTSIVFKAATKEKTTDAYGADVAIGTAAPLPILTPTWTSGSLTVEGALKAGAQSSKTILRVTATFNPKSTPPTATPTLIQWRQNYDCVDAQ